MLGALQATAMIEEGDQDVVPVERWLYLDTEDLKSHAKDKGLASHGSRRLVAWRLNILGKVRYKNVQHPRLLRKMLSREGRSDKGERQVLEKRLRESQPPGKAEEPPSADGASPALEPKPATADGAASDGATASKVDWRRQLEGLEAKLRVEGKKLTKELCAVKLAEWGQLPEDFAVYHIISPSAGGKDHPHNYCCLPNYFPSDYQLEGKAEVHHMLMLEVLGVEEVKRALAAGLSEEADAAEVQAEVKERLAILRQDVAAIRAAAFSCSTSTANDRDGTAAAGGTANGAAVSGADEPSAKRARRGKAAGPAPLSTPGQVAAAARTTADT